MAPLVAGIDGCSSGWVIATSADGEPATPTFDLAPSFAEALQRLAAAAAIAVDMPIGLLDRWEPGGRACDRAARAMLGPGRSASVFAPPTRPALACTSYRAALRANRAGGSTAGRGISIQAFNLFPKLREVDGCMTPALQDRVREVHPELCFYELAGGEPVAAPKRTAAGFNERCRLLAAAGVPDPAAAAHRARAALPGVKLDDAIDALAALWTAHRIARADAVSLPADPPADSRGLRMEILR
ncbi:MAG: DUF429 domain-containing protein [Phycisphaeraceae bacterium]|nr:DUF429 domain-containing protein [Phycisphaeraceae bacterium]